MSNLLFMDESNGNGGYVTTNATAETVASVSRTKYNKSIKNKSNISKNNNNININNTINIDNNQNNNNNNNNNNNINNCNTSTNNISNIMAAASSAAAAAASAAVCVVGVQMANSVSNEDLSQSLSEYTDADESISAPTEFLAEFLSAVMLKDYKKALKYCKLILQYEPDNSTAREFYPLILNKLRITNTSSDSDENYNKSSSSPEFILEAPSSDPSAGESDEHDEQYLRHRNSAYGGLMQGKGLAVTVMTSDNNDPNSNVSSSCSGEVEGEEEEDEADGVEEDGCQSIDSSLSDEDVEDDDEGDVDDDDDCDCDDDDEDEDDDEDDIMSSSGDDLPVDEHHLLVGEVLDLDALSANACGINAAINISNSSRNSSSGGKGSSRSDNTTHSYSSLLLEEEDDIVPANLHFPKDLNTTDLDVSNGNKVPSTSCSDSESPTEPLTQRLAAILRSKCGVSNTDG